MPKPHFRAGVITVVRRQGGEVLAFERNDHPGSWQLPQGGIEPGERPVEAAWRELGEETGLGASHVTLIGEHDGWTIYEWPDRPSRASRLGQVHRWFFFELTDPSAEPRPDGSEFVDWRWVSVDELIEQVVEFRKAPYRQVLGG